MTMGLYNKSKYLERQLKRLAATETSPGNTDHLPPVELPNESSMSICYSFSQTSSHTAKLVFFTRYPLTSCERGLDSSHLKQTKPALWR